MVTRVLELTARPGELEALCDAVENAIRPRLHDVPGFMEAVTLASEGEARLIVFLTVWRSRAAAVWYDANMYPEILRQLEPHLESHAQEHAFQFAHDGGAGAEAADDSFVEAEWSHK